jgi:hypothetical protein
MLQYKLLLFIHNNPIIVVVQVLLCNGQKSLPKCCVTINEYTTINC